MPSARFGCWTKTWIVLRPTTEETRLLPHRHRTGRRHDRKRTTQAPKRSKRNVPDPIRFPALAEIEQLEQARLKEKRQNLLDRKPPHAPAAKKITTMKTTSVVFTLE